MAQRCMRDPVPMSPLGHCPGRPGAIDPQNTGASAGSRSKGFGGRRRAPRSCSVNPHMAALAHRLDGADPVLFVLQQPQLEGPSVRRSPPLPDGPGEAPDLVCARGHSGRHLAPSDRRAAERRRLAVVWRNALRSDRPKQPRIDRPRC
jgi:hypothetical protein